MNGVTRCQHPTLEMRRVGELRRTHRGLKGFLSSLNSPLRTSEWKAMLCKADSSLLLLETMLYVQRHSRHPGFKQMKTKIQTTTETTMIQRPT